MSENLLLDFWNRLTDEQVLLLSGWIAVILCRVHAFRYMRVFVLPLSITFVVVRAARPSSPTILEVIMKIVKSFGNAPVERAIFDLIGLIIVAAIISAVTKLISLDLIGAKKDILAWGFNQVRGLSFVKAELEKEQHKLEEEFDKDLKVKSRALGTQNNVLPKKGMKAESILKLMRDATKVEDVKWESGLVSGAVYNGQHKHIELLNEAFTMYSISNPLHPDIWPSVMKFDSEVISMTANLVNGGDDSVCGSSSSVCTLSYAITLN